MSTTVASTVETDTYPVLAKRAEAFEAEAARREREFGDLLAQRVQLRHEIEDLVGRTDLSEEDLIASERELQTKVAESSSRISALEDAIRLDSAIAAARRAKANDALDAHLRARAAALRPEFTALRERQFRLLGELVRAMVDDERAFFERANGEMFGRAGTHLDALHGYYGISGAFLSALQGAVNGLADAKERGDYADIAAPFRTRASLGLVGDGWTVEAPAPVAGSPTTTKRGWRR